jgi:hypothetical protein
MVDPEIPARAIREEVAGDIQAQIRIKNGVVVEVTFLSGDRMFYPAVKAAIMQYKCTNTGADDVAVQRFLLNQP